jgi:hypothetical protein
MSVKKTENLVPPTIVVNADNSVTVTAKGRGRFTVWKSAQRSNTETAGVAASQPTSFSGSIHVTAQTITWTRGMEPAAGDIYAVSANLLGEDDKDLLVTQVKVPWTPIPAPPKGKEDGDKGKGDDQGKKDADQSKKAATEAKIEQIEARLAKIEADQDRFMAEHQSTGHMPLKWKLVNMERALTQINSDIAQLDESAEVAELLAQVATCTQKLDALKELKPRERINPLGDRLSKVEEEVAGLKTGLGEVRDQVKGFEGKMDDGFGSMRKMITDLKPATPPKLKDDDGDGNNGDKVSSNAQDPYSAGHGLKGLLIGLAVMFVLGLIILCTHLMSSRSAAPQVVVPNIYMGGFQQQRQPIADRAEPEAPASPKGGQHAVTPPPATTSPDELAKIADEMKAIRADQAKFLERERGLMVNTAKPEKAKSGMTIGDNNIVAGHDVTINNYLLPPTSSGKGSPAIATPPPTASVTSSDTTSTTTTTSTGSSGRRHVTKTKCEDRPVYIPRYWSPTLMVGFTCVPVAADGSGSEGYWVYQNPPLPGLPQPYVYTPSPVPTST